MRTCNSCWIRKQESIAISALSEETQQEHINFKQVLQKTFVQAKFLKATDLNLEKTHMHV